MKSIAGLLLIFLLLLCSLSPARAASYEASTLHNAVSRSEAVQDLFFQRWDEIKEKELYLDIFGKINWVPSFKINTINAGSGEKESVNMTLVRTYGSITVNYPIIGGYEGTDITDRLTGTAKKEAEDEDRGSGPMGLWKPKNLIVGFTATGFHYGLTRKANIDRGPSGTETVTDYKYSQFFDDIFALSVLYIPYFHVHGGVIINNQLEPNDDGTMDYSSSVNRETRYFIASNLLFFLDLDITTSDKLESLAVTVTVNKLMEMFLGRLSPLVPELIISYKVLNLYNDEPYDAVWVKDYKARDGTEKTSALADSLKNSAQLHTVSILLKENIGYTVYIDICAEFQKPSETLYSKQTDRELTFDPLRQMYLSVGYNFTGHKAANDFLFMVSGGISRYWDPALPVHRINGSGYYVYGGFGSIKFTVPFGGFELRALYNYGPELKKLVETVDKVALEGSVYFRI